MNTRSTPDPQYLALIDKVQNQLGIDLSSYKPSQMQRRLAIFMQQLGEVNFTHLAARLENDVAARNQFLDFFTINVSEFFRDPEMFDDLRMRVIPLILANNRNKIWTFRMWSAACSIGAEAYSLAMLLDSYFPDIVYQILATDIDRTTLDRARAGGPFSASDIRNVSPTLKMQALTGNVANGFFIKDRYKTFIRFRHHDLNKDSFALKHDLILCRNVLIYFTVPAKEVLYAKLAESLKQGGILFTGGTEFIPSPERFGLLNIGGPFYQKLSTHSPYLLPRDRGLRP